MSVIVSQQQLSFAEARIYWQESDRIYGVPIWTENFKAATKYPSVYDIHLPTMYSGELEFIFLNDLGEPEIILSFVDAFRLTLPTE